MEKKIEVFTDHKNITHETIESYCRRVQIWKSILQEFGVNLIYIKGEANVIANDCIRIPMVHHAHKLADTTMEKENCELMCLDLLLFSDNTNYFSLDIEDISFLLAPKTVQAGHKLELQSQLSTNIRTDINKTNSYWKYKPVKGINLVHCCDRTYVPQTLRKRALKWNHCYLQHPGGDRLAQALTTICR